MEFLKFLSGETTKSVRRFLAYGSGSVFFASCIYTMIITNGALDPTQYMIIGGVFAAYFGKELFKKADIKVVTARRDNENNENS
jgi:hypothetical protein